jgi:hypothetical protein
MESNQLHLSIDTGPPCRGDHNNCRALTSFSHALLKVHQRQIWHRSTGRATRTIAAYRLLDQGKANAAQMGRTDGRKRITRLEVLSPRENGAGHVGTLQYHSSTAAYKGGVGRRSSWTARGTTPVRKGWPNNVLPQPYEQRDW